MCKQPFCFEPLGSSCQDMMPDSIPIRIKLRVLLDVRKHMTLSDEEFRQLLIDVLREYMKDSSAAWEDPDDCGARAQDVEHEGAPAPRIRVASSSLDDRLRGKAVDDFIAAARRLVADPAEEGAPAH